MNQELTREERAFIAETVAQFAKTQVATNMVNFHKKFGFAPVEIFVGASIGGICQFAYEVRGDATIADLEALICDAVKEAFKVMEVAVKIPPTAGSA